MPAAVDPVRPGEKRKWNAGHEVARKAPKRKAATEDDASVQDEILQVESDIVEHGDYRRGVDTLLALFLDHHEKSDIQLAAGVALCRTLYRLIAGERLIKHKGSSPEERHLVDWLRLQSGTFIDELCRLLQSRDGQVQSTALTLLMRLVKAEVSQQDTRSTQAWKTGAFARLLEALVSSDAMGPARAEFVETFVEEHDDVRYFTYATIGGLMREVSEDRKLWKSLVASCLDLLLHVEGIPESKDQLEDWYGRVPESSSHPLLSLNAHKKQAQDAWLQIFKSPLSSAQRKRILESFTERVVPWFSKPEMLMDFLTDSYDSPGATSLLAVEGIYYLIREQNLDYPQFYLKLYSLLDEGILHSKHRAKFFGLLEVFLASTHLPAALVASFMKRLSRLALHAPPGGIVMVVPWTYNMLKKHPQCTFMIHREVRDLEEKMSLEAGGMDDPFDMAEQDPMQTHALESSLWELHSLQQHYHPNVATLAKIMSEQFTKEGYNLDDFLDHTYDGLVGAELGKELKKAPVVEFEIPKRIVTNDDGALNEAGLLLEQAIIT